MNSEEYVDKKGAVCLNCESSDIDGGPLMVEEEEGKAYRTVSCLNCGSEWTDVYKLIEVIEVTI